MLSQNHHQCITQVKSENTEDSTTKKNISYETTKWLSNNSIKKESISNYSINKSTSDCSLKYLLIKSPTSKSL